MLAGRGTLWLTKKQGVFPCLSPQSQKKPKTAKNLPQIPACARALDAEPCQPFDGFSDGGSEKQRTLHLLRVRSPTALVERSRHLLGEEEIVCPLRASEKPVERVERFFRCSAREIHFEASKGSREQNPDLRALSAACYLTSRRRNLLKSEMYVVDLRATNSKHKDRKDVPTPPRSNYLEK